LGGQHRQHDLSSACELPLKRLGAGEAASPCGDRTSIVNGTSIIYREQLKDTPTERTASGAEEEQNREYLPQEGLKQLKLLYEVLVEYRDEAKGWQYSGKMDWALGFAGQLVPGEPGGSKDISTGAGYRTLLVVVEVKGPETYSRASAQLLAYMACLYRNREARGTREDSSAFGITTDGIMGGCAETRQRLGRLPANEKREIAVQQILPILTYGCKLFPDPQ